MGLIPQERRVHSLCNLIAPQSRIQWEVQVNHDRTSVCQDLWNELSSRGNPSNSRWIHVLIPFQESINLLHNILFYQRVGKESVKALQWQLCGAHVIPSHGHGSSTLSPCCLSPKKARVLAWLWSSVFQEH